MNVSLIVLLFSHLVTNMNCTDINCISLSGITRSHTYALSVQFTVKALRHRWGYTEISRNLWRQKSLTSALPCFLDGCAALTESCLSFSLALQLHWHLVTLALFEGIYGAKDLPGTLGKQAHISNTIQWTQANLPIIFKWILRIGGSWFCFPDGYFKKISSSWPQHRCLGGLVTIHSVSMHVLKTLEGLSNAQCFW